MALLLPHGLLKEPEIGPSASQFLRSVLRLLVTANVIPSSLIFVTWMIEAIFFSETSVFTRTTRCHIPEDGILR
jgi:hypothetical protein